MDVKKLLILFVVTFVLVGVSLSGKKDVFNMPLVEDTNPITSKFQCGYPQPDRGIEFRRFLSPSVKIALDNGCSGSGTIIYYDSNKNEAYVTSCGHLWEGSKNSKELESDPEKVTIISWYHNQTKLSSPLKYSADVLFWSNVKGYDCSLLKFTPDWVPDYFPIASINYPLVPGEHYHSVGCDSGSEVARYDVEIVEYRGNDLIIKNNIPRPGRSGGGMLSDTGFYVATCWGTTDKKGLVGIGLFTPLESIHKVYKNNGYSWVIDAGNSLARKIPIIEIDGKEKIYPRDYVPLPNNNSIKVPR